MSDIRTRLMTKGHMHPVAKYTLVVLGAAIGAAGFQFFMFPNSIVSGGLTGIAQIINRLCGLPVGVLSIVLNIPLFIIAWRQFGVKFTLDSFIGTVIFSVFIDLASMLDYTATNDPMLGSIIGGVIKGIGLGAIYYVGATTGGMDIVARFLRRRYPYINFGTFILLLDAVIIAAYAFIFHIVETAMYSLICMFVVSKAVDLVLYGLDNSSIVYIVSRNTDVIVREITSGSLHRGVTLLHGEGAYTHEEHPVIMCVIKRPQIAEIRRLVRTIDEQAFLVVTDAKNVFGNGFDSINDNN